MVHMLIREAREQDMEGVLGLYRYPYMLIENVVTAPQYRRKGYGRALLQNAMDLARRHNCYKIMLLSNAGRKEAHGFYMSLGFEGKSKIGFQMRL